MSNNVFDRIRGGLAKTRDNISSKLGSVISSFSKIDEDFYEELEETLILCDIGVAAAGEIIKGLYIFKELHLSCLQFYLSQQLQ